MNFYFLWSFILTVTFSSHLIFWPFTTMTSISHYSMSVKYSSFKWCTMMHHYLLNILQYIPCHNSCRLLCRNLHIQKVCPCHLLFLLFSTNNKLPCGPYFYGFVILHWSGFFCYSSFCLPRNQFLCDRIFTIIAHTLEEICPVLIYFSIV